MSKWLRQWTTNPLCSSHVASNPILSKLSNVGGLQCWGLPGGSVVKNPPMNVRDAGLIPGSGRFPREGNGNPIQCSCLGNPMDREVRWTTVHRVIKTDGHNLVTKQQQNNIRKI